MYSLIPPSAIAEGFPNLKALSHMYRRAWSKSLKTTCYLRTLQASHVEKSTIDVKKQTCGEMAGGAAKPEPGRRSLGEGGYTPEQV